MQQNFAPVAAALAFGTVGIIITMLGFKAFDWVTPKIDVQKELAERNNTAVAIVTAAVILGVAYVAAHAIS